METMQPPLRRRSLLSLVLPLLRRFGDWCGQGQFQAEPRRGKADRSRFDHIVCCSGDPNLSMSLRIAQNETRPLMFFVGIWRESAGTTSVSSRYSSVCTPYTWLPSFTGRNQALPAKADRAWFYR